MWVRPIGSLEYRAVDGTNGATFVFWKPDGRGIGFFTGGKLKTVPLDAGGAVEVCDAPVGSRFDAGGTWNSDNVIVFMSQSGALQRISASGGAPAPVTELQTGDTAHRWPSFLPDGRHFLYLAQQGKASGGLRIASLDGRRRSHSAGSNPTLSTLTVTCCSSAADSSWPAVSMCRSDG